MVPRGELESLGGWRPVPSGVDRAFLDRVLQGGGSIYRTWPTGFIYRRHGKGHTWGPADEYFLRGVGAQWDGHPGPARVRHPPGPSDWPAASRPD